MARPEGESNPTVQFSIENPTIGGIKDLLISQSKNPGMFITYTMEGDERRLSRIIDSKTIEQNLAILDKANSEMQLPGAIIINQPRKVQN